VSRQSLCPHAHTTHKHCDAGVVGNLRELGRRFTPCTRARSPCAQDRLVPDRSFACGVSSVGSAPPVVLALLKPLFGRVRTSTASVAHCSPGSRTVRSARMGCCDHPLRGSCVKLPYAALERVQGSYIMRRGRPRCAGRRKCVGCSGVFGRSGALSSSSSTHKLVVLRQAVAGQCTPPAKNYWAL